MKRMTINEEENRIIELLETAEDMTINDEAAEQIEEAISQLLNMFNSGSGTDNLMEVVASGRENGYKNGYKKGYADGNENGFNRGIDKGIKEMEKLYNMGKKR